MAVVKRYNPNKIFFPDRMIEKLETIYENNLTVVEAPTGFGKTTSVRNILNDSQEAFIWVNIENENKDEFFEELCNSIQNIDASVAAKLKTIGFPVDLESCNKIANILSDLELSEKYILVLDNYQYISDYWIGNTIISIVNSENDNLRFVLLTQSIKTTSMLNLVVESKINYIGKSDLEFSCDEILEYFRTCGVKINDEEADYLSKYTEGWISAIYLQMLHYISNNTFEPDTGIDKLVCKAIWDKLSIEEQDFLISISIFDSFSLRQALYMGVDELQPDLMKKLLNSNAFIRYDSKDRKYFTHTILRYFLKTEFDKLDRLFKNKIFKKTAKWYEENENYFMALQYYNMIREYDAIYEMQLSMDDLLNYVTRENKQMFLNIISSVSMETKEKNLRRSIIFSFILFLYNERDFFDSECNLIRSMIENSTHLREREKEILLGENIFINSFIKYNNLSAIYDDFIKAFDYMKSPSTIFSSKISIIFKNPSVVCCFHSVPGKLEDELQLFEKMVVEFYKLTAGNSKGLEALMRAEILFNRCNFKDAQVLCEKALYMAETRNQVNVYISTMLLLARIAAFEGDYDNMRYILISMRKKIDVSGEVDKKIMADLSDGFVYIQLNKTTGIPNWLKDEKLIEEKCTTLNLGFANIIYGKYLLLNGNYSKFLGISGQMLGMAGVYNNIMYDIYIYIYISIANYYVGNSKKAVKFLNEAMELGYKDSIYIPFIENYSELWRIYTPDSKYQQYIDFFETVTSEFKHCEKEYKVVQKACCDDIDYGLTNRELQIAMLAAQRLTNKEIAEKLYIAEGTVKSNLKMVFSKLQIKSRSELKNFF